MDNCLIAQVVRANALESSHSGLFAFYKHKEQQFLGNFSDELVCLRSVAKPFQTLACLRAGLELKHAQIAIGSSSHSGSPVHIKRVKELLHSYVLDWKWLKCGEHPPLDRTQAWALEATIDRRLQNNCSGKHSMLLATCKLNGWDLHNYVSPLHPIGQKVLQTIAELCEVEPTEIEVAVDGCGLPTYALKISKILKGFSKFRPDSQDRLLAKVAEAFRAHPDLISGVDRLDCELTKAFASIYACKSGAGGLTVLSLPEGALLVKMYDNDEKIRALLLKRLLIKLGHEFCSDHALFKPYICNLHGLSVAEINWNEEVFQGL